MGAAGCSEIDFRASPAVAGDHPVVVLALVGGGVDVGSPNHVRGQLLAEARTAVPVQPTTRIKEVVMVDVVVVGASHRVPADAYRRTFQGVPHISRRGTVGMGSMGAAGCSESISEHPPLLQATTQ